jgi:hypothetical protein
MAVKVAAEDTSSILKSGRPAMIAKVALMIGVVPVLKPPKPAYVRTIVVLLAAGSNLPATCDDDPATALFTGNMCWALLSNVAPGVLIKLN